MATSLTCSRCSCATFSPNLYRPGLCTSCFHSVADHSKEWVLSADGTHFVHSASASAGGSARADGL
jgi:hypothetical protein